MYAKKGMILIETLLFFMIVILLTTILCQCARLWYHMDLLETKGYDDEKVQEIYRT